MINQIIGKYKLIRLICEGGMASVYEGEHTKLGTKAAVKVLNPMLSTNKQIHERFVNEAKLMASLNHPNITKVIDYEESDSALAIVMELLEGEDLNDVIKKRGALSEKDIVNYFYQSLSALQYAHENGVVHRDIKPSNIFILPNGSVKILDFGIAKLFGQGNEMTQTGTQIGTPIYMSPEQVKGDKSIDHRSDIYSLGVTMYYALNGKPPYDANTTSQFDIFNKIVIEPLPELTGKGYLSELIMKACEKDRDMRFQACTEWIDALKNKEVSSASTADKKVVEAPVSHKTFVGSTTDFSEERSNVESQVVNQDEPSDKGNLNTQDKPKKSKQNKVLVFSILGVLAIAVIVGSILYIVQKSDTGTSDNIVTDDIKIIALLNKADSLVNSVDPPQFNSAWKYMDSCLVNDEKLGDDTLFMTKYNRLYNITH